MVASIASSHSRARSCLKSLLLTLCVSGFLYQCTTFLLHVFDYPTVLDLDIETPEEITVPAYTVCINNGIKRSIFCDLYPERCYQPGEKFCKHLHGYCGENRTLIPKEDYYTLETTMEYVDILKFGSNMSDFVESGGKLSENLEGPFLRLKNEIQMTGSIICYSLHSVVHNQKDARKEKRQVQVLGEEPIDELGFYVKEDEMFIPGSRPGVFFSVHSPYESVNPFTKGLFMKPGRTYRIYVTMTQEVLLKDPFTTKCINYEEVWEANNRTGPRIQEMCQHKCILELSLACFNCVAPVILYPSDERMCNKEEMETVRCTQEDFIKFKACYYEQCRDDCRVTKYTPEVKDRYEIYPVESDMESLEDNHRLVRVEIFLSAGEVMTLKYSPKYLHVEIFSAIGGFIGCWLGISLMDITDFFGSIFMVLSYAWRKSWRK